VTMSDLYAGVNQPPLWIAGNMEHA